MQDNTSKIIDKNGEPLFSNGQKIVLLKTKSKNVNPQPKGSLTEAVENVAQHQATGFSRSTNTSIADNSIISNVDKVYIIFAIIEVVFVKKFT